MFVKLFTDSIAFVGLMGNAFVYKTKRVLFGVYGTQKRNKKLTIACYEIEKGLEKPRHSNA